MQRRTCYYRERDEIKPWEIHFGSCELRLSLIVEHIISDRGCSNSYSFKCEGIESRFNVYLGVIGYDPKKIK
jgi:hypothetical protein